MFLHIGGDYSVAFQDVLSIHDYEKSLKSAVNRKFIEKNKDKIVNLAGDEPKTLVVTKDKMYLSAISAVTLKIRAEQRGM